MTDKKTEVATVNAKGTAKQVSDLLGVESMQKQLRILLPKYLTPERFVRVARTLIQTTPKLAECSAESLVSSLVELAEVGLEPGSFSGEAYLVPFYNKHTRQKEAQAMLGYKGLVKMARNSGKITQVAAHTVHEKDEFSFELGDHPKLVHRPDWRAENPGEPVAYYATALWKNGGREFIVMTPREVEARRQRSRAKDIGPWVTDYDPMAQKTVLKKLCRLLPLTSAAMIMVAQDDLRDQAIDVTASEVEDREPPKTLEDLKAEMKGLEPNPEMIAEAGHFDTSVTEAIDKDLQAEFNISQKAEEDKARTPATPTD